MISRLSAAEAADEMREMANSCRRLAKRARTSAGGDALRAVAEQFDSDARIFDLRGRDRFTFHGDF